MLFTAQVYTDEVTSQSLMNARMRHNKPSEKLRTSECRSGGDKVFEAETAVTYFWFTKSATGLFFSLLALLVRDRNVYDANQPENICR